MDYQPKNASEIGPCPRRILLRVVLVGCVGWTCRLRRIIWRRINKHGFSYCFLDGLCLESLMLIFTISMFLMQYSNVSAVIPGKEYPKKIYGVQTI